MTEKTPMITRTYPAKCSNCNGTGVDYKQINGYDTSAVCVVCNGNKTITVTEVIEDITTHDFKTPDQARDDYYNRPKLFEHK